MFHCSENLVEKYFIKKKIKEVKTMLKIQRQPTVVYLVVLGASGHLLYFKCIITIIQFLMPAYQSPSVVCYLVHGCD